MTTAVAELPDTEPFRRKDKVVAAVDLPGIPAGTAGKVIFVAGFDWIRYWVRLGQRRRTGLDQPQALVRPRRAVRRRAGRAARQRGPGGRQRWCGCRCRRRRGRRVAATSRSPACGSPARLLERSKKRREFLGA